MHKKVQMLTWRARKILKMDTKNTKQSGKRVGRDGDPVEKLFMKEANFGKNNNNVNNIYIKEKKEKEDNKKKLRSK